MCFCAHALSVNRRISLHFKYRHKKRNLYNGDSFFVKYRGIIQSLCAQIPVARAAKFYTVAHDIFSILRADFSVHTKVCITAHVLSRKCPKREVHRAFPNCGSWVGNSLHFTLVASRIWRLLVDFWEIRRRLVVVTWLANLISSN